MIEEDDRVVDVFYNLRELRREISLGFANNMAPIKLFCQLENKKIK